MPRNTRIVKAAEKASDAMDIPEIIPIAKEERPEEMGITDTMEVSSYS
jgi:hypothetical protein